MPEADVIWDAAAFEAWLKNTSQSPQMALYRLAVRVTVAMKAACPVSKVPRVYAARGATVPGGARFAGDFPLPPSGRLRKSIVRYKDPAAGDWIIGPTLDYGVWVNDGTPPHPISSTGPWPLRNRVTGQVFGRHVRHPGTRPAMFIQRSLDAIRGVAEHV